MWHNPTDQPADRPTNQRTQPVIEVLCAHKKSKFENIHLDCFDEKKRREKERQRQRERQRDRERKREQRRKSKIHLHNAVLLKKIFILRTTILRISQEFPQEIKLSYSNDKKR